MLFVSALIAAPATVVVAYLYGRWSSKKSMILYALLTAAATIGFAIVNPGASGEQSSYLTPLTVLLLVGSGGVIAMLSPYTAEVYPTQVRGTGSGFAAGTSAGKSGGSDRDDPVICIQLRDDEECPALPIGPIIGL